MLNPSSNVSTQQLGVQVFQQMLRRPLAFWGGVWASLVIVACVAALGLLNPGTIESEGQPETTPKVVDDSSTELLPTTADVSQTSQFSSTAFQNSQISQGGFRTVDASTPGSGIPIWLFGAVALTCATGSLLIYGSMRESSQRRRRSLKRETSLRAVSSTGNRKKQQLSPPRSRQKRPKSGLGSPISTIDAPLVTVLPPEKSHSLDWGKDSLADVVDLRKRQSLASLLRDR